ncbi:MAG: DNA methyltransferase, partial [Burkholderiales bacterium]
MEHPNGLRALAYFDTLFPPEEARQPSSREDILEEIKKFNRFGASTQVARHCEITYYFNVFLTSGQRKAHSIHEISYRACFKPQLPEFFIHRLTQAGDAVLDPFMGRGTTPVAAGLLGCRAFGNDINPLSVLLTRPRLKSPNFSDVQRALMQIDWTVPIDVPAELLAFYHPETIRQICILRDHLLKRAPLDLVAPYPALDWVR